VLALAAGRVLSVETDRPVTMHMGDRALALQAHVPARVAEAGRGAR
jgi:hypothetical protein